MRIDSSPPRVGRRLANNLFGMLIAVLPCAASAQAWVAPGDGGLRRLVERLVDERTLDLPTLNWPIPKRDLETAIATARRRNDLAPTTLAKLAELEQQLGASSTRSSSAGTWSMAVGDPTELRGFADAPRASGEASLEWRWHDPATANEARWSGELHVTAALDPADGTALQPDGSYLALSLGNVLLSAGWQDRWWGGGSDGSLQLSSNARPVFALSVDRERSTPFQTPWLRWLGPWTMGTFMGALEARRIDSNHALLWGFHSAARPLPGLEISVTRNAQFCGSTRPCSGSIFWNVLTGHDNRGENVSTAKEPGNQLATYEIRWAGELGQVPLSIGYQNTGETIDNKFPRPLRSLALISLASWGDYDANTRWRAHLEFASTTCSDFNYAQSADCGYENSTFTGGYRYRGRVLGHSIDSDTRQYTLGLAIDDGRITRELLLRRAEINRIGSIPQPNHALAPNGPQTWWTLEGHWRGELARGRIELQAGLERIHDDLRGTTSTRPRGWLRYTAPL